MKKQNSLFICDSCKKEEKNCEDFPYDKGWVYLYSLSFKKIKSKINESKDKHFCSQLCLELFLKKMIDEAK